MRHPAILVAIGVIALAGAGCRQSDGPMPKEMTDTANRVDDLSRDLLAVAGGEATAVKDFTDDLQAFAESPKAVAAATKLGEQIAASVKGKKLTPETAHALARSSWIAVAAREYSHRQVEQLQKDFETQLTSVGAPQPQVQAVTASVAETQAAITARSRRWYEVF